MESKYEDQLQQVKQLQLQINQLELQIESQQKEEQMTKESSEQQDSEHDQGKSDKSNKEKKPLYYELPKVLTAIELGQIQTLLSANLLAIKQFRQATQNCHLPDLKKQFEEAGQMHLKHYNELLSLLGENGGSST
ncbi:ferritin family protein [Sporosarcina sp. CAU 1771]